MAARAAVQQALASGTPAVRLYAEVVRPFAAPYSALAGGVPAAQRRALARSVAHAALADLAPAHAAEPGVPAPRAAAVLVPPGLLGELDAALLGDVLEPLGWPAVAIALDAPAEEVVREVAACGAELVLVPATEPEHVLAAQCACAQLRWLTAPPMVVTCAVSPRPEPGGLAADAFLTDPTALPELLRRRIGGPGPNWGVRLSRDGQALVIAPVGVLDATAALRLRDVAESRRMLYDRLLLDLSELLSVEEAGMAGLAAWHREQPWGAAIALCDDDRTQAALLAAGLAATLPVV